MPLPLLLGGAAILATAVGASSHKDAHETNEKAESLARKARGLYDDSKESLEVVQKDTEKLLLKLGNEKKKVLAGSMKKFVESYDRIKNIQLKESGGLTELSRFSIEQQDVVQIRQLSDIYTTSIQSGAAGAATGAVIALAASGTLPVVTGALSMAGTCLTWGSVGAAASIAGSAISTAVAATPLAAIVAPAVFFTGISASMKADENLEKAKTMYAEAERASEEMKISETLCEAIGKRSEMFHELLLKLDGMFSECTDMLADVISEKDRQGGRGEITAGDLNRNELELVAVTRALAGAVKSVIDTPILSEDGKVTKESLDVYNNSTKCLPDFSKAVREMKEAPRVEASRMELAYQQSYRQSYQQQMPNTGYIVQDAKINGRKLAAENDSKGRPVIVILGIVALGLVVICVGLMCRVLKLQTNVTTEVTDNTANDVLSPEMELINRQEDRKSSEAADILESQKETEEVIVPLTDEEIISTFMANRPQEGIDYSDVVIKETDQTNASLLAKISCTTATAEGIKEEEYTTTLKWEDGEWVCDQIEEMGHSLFKPLSEPEDETVTNYIVSQMGDSSLHEEGTPAIELIEKDWADKEAGTYLYKYQQIEKSGLVGTRQNIEAEVKFDRENGYWDYDAISSRLDDKLQKIYILEGTWEGEEYETYEASWKYVIEILSVDSDNNAITINSWCEFASSTGVVEKTTVCEEETIMCGNGEYAIPVGGYIVDRTASDGMDFTYNFIIENGKLFVNEENEGVFLSVPNAKMSIFLGIEMARTE